MSRADRLAEQLHALALTQPTDGQARRRIRGAAKAAWMTWDCLCHPMARGNRLRAVGRLWGWQLWRRSLARPLWVRLGDGSVLRCQPWSILAGSLISVGLYEADELAFLLDAVLPDDVLLDAGANVGLYTVVGARAGARVVAYEPTPRTRAELEANVRLNGLEDRVLVCATALADFNGEAQFTQSMDVGDHLEPLTEVGGVTVAVARLDDHLERPAVAAWLGGWPIAFLKVDVEGFDLELLRGAATTLATHRPVIIVETWADGASVRTWLDAHGYIAHRYRRADHTLQPLARGFDRQFNIIGVPAERVDALQEKLRAAPRRLLPPPRVTWCRPPDGRGT